MLLSQACRAASQMDIPVNYRSNPPCSPAALEHGAGDVLAKEVAVSHSMAWLGTGGLVLFSHLPGNAATSTTQPSLAVPASGTGLC